MACFSRNSADVVQELRLRRPAVVRAARRRRRRRRRRAGGVATLLSMSGRHAVGPTHQVPQVQVRRPPSRPQGECDVIADFGRRCVPIGREWTAFVTLSLAAALRWRSSTTDTRCRRTLNSPTWPTSSRGPRCVSLRFFFLVCPFFCVASALWSAKKNLVSNLARGPDSSQSGHRLFLVVSFEVLGSSFST